MSDKNYAEVLIDGTVFTLAGTEDEGYLRRVAAYLNEKIGEVKKIPRFFPDECRLPDADGAIKSGR